VLGQLFVLARLEGRSRSVALGGTGVLWGLSWLALSVSGISSNTTVLVLALITTATVFALGETIWSPTFPALVNDLAPDDLRGRYNALSTMTWSVGGVLGPVFAGFLLGSHHSLLWVYLTVAGCWVGAVLAVALRRVLSPVEDGRVSSASATMEE
jgi:MFS family permease